MKVDKRKINLAMMRACMNSTDVAAAAGIPAVTVRKIMTGYGTTHKTLGRIARALGVDPAELIEEGDKAHA